MTFEEFGDSVQDNGELAGGFSKLSTLLTDSFSSFAAIDNYLGVISNDTEQPEQIRQDAQKAREFFEKIGEAIYNAETWIKDTF